MLNEKYQLHLVLLLKVIFGIVFIFSGATKLIDLNAFAEALVNFKLISNELIEIVKYAVPIFEILLGLGIILNFNSGIPAILASLMLSFFTALIIAKIFEGEEISCGCFGALSSDKLDELSILRNVILISIAIAISTYYENKKTKAEEKEEGVCKYKTLHLIFIANLIFFLASQSFIFALQNNGLKSRLALLVNDYDILKEGDIVKPFEFRTSNNEIINVNYNEINEQTLVFILKPGCSPCKANLPNWKYLIEQINSLKTRIFPISIDEIENTDRYISENSIPFPVYANKTDDFLLNYKAFLTPQTILIDDSGRVVKNWKGILNENAISEILNNINNK